MIPTQTPLTCAQKIRFPLLMVIGRLSLKKESFLKPIHFHTLTTYAQYYSQAAVPVIAKERP